MYFAQPLLVVDPAKDEIQTATEYPSVGHNTPSTVFETVCEHLDHMVGFDHPREWTSLNSSQRTASLSRGRSRPPHLSPRKPWCSKTHPTHSAPSISALRLATREALNCSVALNVNPTWSCSFLLDCAFGPISLARFQSYRLYNGVAESNQSRGAVCFPISSISCFGGFDFLHVVDIRLG